MPSGSGPTDVNPNATLYDDAYDCKSPYRFQGSATLSTTNPADTFRVWGNVKFRFQKSINGVPPPSTLYLARPLIAKGARFETVDSTAVSGTNLWAGLRLSSSGSVFLDSCTVRNAIAGIAHLASCSPIGNAVIERSTFTNNWDADVWLYFDHTRNPTVRLVGNKFHTPRAVIVGVGGTSIAAVGTATILNNFFYGSQGPYAELELKGGWQGQINANNFTISQYGAMGLWLVQQDGICTTPGAYASPSVTLSGNRFSTAPSEFAMQAPKRSALVTQINASYNDWSRYTSSQIAGVILDGADPSTPDLAIVAFEPWSSPPGGGGGGGCPFVLSDTDDGFRVENSLLGRSEEAAEGRFVADAYPLSLARLDPSGRVRLRIAELEEDTDEIDELSLGGVDVPEGYKLATDPSGKPVLIRPVEIPVRPSAWSGKQLPFTSPVAPGSAYRGEPGDSVEFEVQPGTMVGVVSSSQRIGVQLIPKLPNSASLRRGPIGVTIRVSPDAGSERWFTLDPVIPREFWSTDVLPLTALAGEAIRRVRIIWHTPHTLGWVGLVEAREVQAQTLPCVTATHSSGASVMAELQARDGVKTTLAPGEHVELEFDGSNAPAGLQYVLQAYGRYYRMGGGKAPASPAAYFLAQNRPNPFNPATSIEFGLPVPTRVTLRVFNVAGRLVRTLLDKQMPAGFHTSRWDGRDDRGASVSSGVYFYELRGGTFVDRRRMVLLR